VKLGETQNAKKNPVNLVYNVHPVIITELLKTKRA